MSANTGILTYQNGTFQVSSVYYAPTVTIPVTGEYLAPLYCFLSRVLPWENEVVPPVPTEDQKYLKQVFKNMFVAKAITSNDISGVIERINWTSGETYSYYRDDINMHALEPNGTIAQRFYVKNRYDQVFKCLWNNNDGDSTVEPYFEPGTFNANQIFQGADNYKWKYIYTITSGSKLKFMDDAWMPIPLGTNTINPVQSTAGRGSIEVINVTNGGLNYNPANATISVVITGDGSGATANVSVSGNSISDIVVTAAGSNYTYANVSIVSAEGSGAAAVAPTSPIGGHGFDPISELGARHVMLTAQFNKDEGGLIPTDIDFRQIGVLVSPYAYFGNSVGLANASIYSTTTDFTVSQGFGAYTPDEVVYQSPNGLFENATYTATVLSFDSTFNKVKLINTGGEAVDGLLLIGNSTGTARTVLQQETPSFIPFSGYLTYLENRSAITRNVDGSEQIRIVLGY
jgi:hypothetical protein